MARKTGKNQTQRQLSLKLFAIAVPTILFISLFVLSYSNFYPPLLDKKYIFALDNLVASLPLIPKTPKQVVTKSFFSNRSLKSYSAGGEITLQSGEAEKLSLNFVGKVNKAGLFGSSSLASVKGEVSGAVNGVIDFQTVTKNETFYFRTVGNLGLEDFDPTLLGSDWYQIELDKFQTNLAVVSKKDSEIITDISEQMKAIVEDFLNNKLFSGQIRSQTLKIDKEAYYQFVFEIDKGLLNKFNFLNGYTFDRPELTLLINKQTFYLEKLDLKADVEPRTKEIFKRKMTLALDYQVFNINKEQKIETPKNSKLLTGPIDLSLALSGQDQADNEKFLLATQKTLDRGQNFLTIERLLRVVLLLPKSIYYN